MSSTRYRQCDACRYFRVGSS